jgi:hypothetical protein
MNQFSDNNPFEVLRLGPNTPAEQVVQHAGALRQQASTEDELAAIRVAVQRLTGRPEDRLLHEFFTHPEPHYRWPSLEAFQATFRRLPPAPVEPLDCPPLDLAECAGRLRQLAAEEWQTPPQPLEALGGMETTEELQRQKVEILWQSLLADSGA